LERILFATSGSEANLSHSAPIGHARFYSQSNHLVIRVYDELGNVIKAHEHAVEFKETMIDIHDEELPLR
jgi:hypothetical protein